jgi:hypothetical protein
MASLDLRPLSLGELLDRTFFLYRRHFLLFVGIAAIPYLIVVIAFLAPGLLLYLIPAGGPMTPSGRTVIQAIGGIFLLAVGFIALVAFLYSAGASIFAVSEIYAGRRPSIRGSYALVRGKAATILGIIILSLLIVIAGMIALVIPGLYLICRIPVATAAAMIEDLGPIESIRKSFALTAGFAGRSALIYLLVIGLTYGVGLVFQLPFLALAAAAPKQSHLLLLWTVLGQVGGLLGGILVGAVPTIAFALFYYDLRVRKEAFDLQMMMQAIGADPAPPAITGGVPSMFGRDAS